MVIFFGIFKSVLLHAFCRRHYMKNVVCIFLRKVCYTSVYSKHKKCKLCFVVDRNWEICGSLIWLNLSRTGVFPPNDIQPFHDFGLGKERVHAWLGRGRGAGWFRSGYTVHYTVGRKTSHCLGKGWVMCHALKVEAPLCLVFLTLSASMLYRNHNTVEQ